MPRLRIAAIAIAAAALGIAPATAQATPTSTSITSWVSTGANGTFDNAQYLISLDNPPSPTTLRVTGSAPGASTGDRLDVVCFYGSGQFTKLFSNLLVSTPSDTFDTGAVALRPIAGHACRLRAVPAGSETTTGESSVFAGPQVAVSEAALPSATFDSKPYDFYVNALTFSGNAAWTSAGSTASCGPAVAPLDPAFDIGGNFAINCAGSLQGSDLPTGGDRSEVQVDGQNSYDAASAHALLGAGADPLTFPSLSVSVQADPSDGLISSQSTEGWVVCPGAPSYPPTAATCPHFASAGIQLQRSIGSGTGGDVVTMTDTWSSTDGKAHSLDLLYDDSVGATKFSTQRGYEFPGQSAFSAYGAGATLPAPGSAPGSIFMRSNLAAPDGATSEAVGAITFSSPPSGFSFISNGEFREHQLLQVPAGGSTSLTYIYSTAFTIAQTAALALSAQDRMQPLALAISSPPSGTVVSSPSVVLSGTAAAGSGIASLVVGGQSVPVGAGGAWSATVPLASGSNTITALATDGAGATAQSQVTAVYQPPSPPVVTAPVVTPAVSCKVPQLKNMKLAKAERALRRAHCRVGKIKHVHSKKIGRGRVTGTVPRPGRRLPGGTRVGLFVSQGR